MDFDGTLVDFELDPAAVRLPASRQMLLQSFDTRADLSAAIVSGRRITDLRERAAAGSGVFYAGLHGLEIEGPGMRFTHHAASAAAPTLGVLVAEVKKATKGLTGVMIEDKGLSIVLHVRGASTDAIRNMGSNSRIVVPDPRRLSTRRSPPASRSNSRAW